MSFENTQIGLGPSIEQSKSPNETERKPGMKPDLSILTEDERQIYEDFKKEVKSGNALVMSPEIRNIMLKLSDAPAEAYDVEKARRESEAFVAKQEEIRKQEAARMAEIAGSIQASGTAENNEPTLKTQYDLSVDSLKGKPSLLQRFKKWWNTDSKS